MSDICWALRRSTVSTKLVNQSKKWDKESEALLQECQPCRSVTSKKTHTAMTSVNSPACLLARNHFYRNLSPSPEQMQRVFNRQKKSEQRSQRQITLWVTMTAPPEFPVDAGTKGFCVNIVLGSSSSRPSNSKQSSPAERDVK